MVTISDITTALRHRFGESVTPEALSDLSRSDDTLLAARQIGIWIGEKSGISTRDLASAFAEPNIRAVRTAAILRSDDDHHFAADFISVNETLGLSPFRMG